VKGGDNDYGFLHRSVHIGRHIRNPVRNVAARQGVTRRDSIIDVERCAVAGRAWAMGGSALPVKGIVTYDLARHGRESDFRAVSESPSLSWS